MLLYVSHFLICITIFQSFHLPFKSFIEATSHNTQMYMQIGSIQCYWSAALAADHAVLTVLWCTVYRHHSLRLHWWRGLRRTMASSEDHPEGAYTTTQRAWARVQTPFARGSLSFQAITHPQEDDHDFCSLSTKHAYICYVHYCSNCYYKHCTCVFGCVWPKSILLLQVRLGNTNSCKQHWNQTTGLAATQNLASCARWLCWS